MRPAQRADGLPADVATWLERWRRRTRGAVGRCWRAMQEAPSIVQVERGMLVYRDRSGQVAALTHVWGRWDGRVVDPTIQQAGVGPVRLLRIADTCPSCGAEVARWWPSLKSIDGYCGCYHGGDCLQRAVIGESYVEDGAPTADDLWARLAEMRVQSWREL